MGAQAHFEKDAEGFAGSIEYHATTAEALVAQGEKFDVVCSFEVVEHVADAADFVASCSALVKDGGAVFLSTISRTEASYAIAIVAAEGIISTVPPGTHDYDKFITPEELSTMLRQNGVFVEKKEGMIYK